MVGELQMENKKILVAVLLASILVLSGCAVKDYLKRYVVTEGGANFTLLSEKEKYLNETEDITEVLTEKNTNEVI